MHLFLSAYNGSRLYIVNKSDYFSSKLIVCRINIVIVDYMITRRGTFVYKLASAMFEYS